MAVGESYLYACAELRKLGKVGVAAVKRKCREMSLARLRQLSEVQQRRAACLLGAIVADTAGETLRDSRDLVYIHISLAS